MNTRWIGLVASVKDDLLLRPIQNQLGIVFFCVGYGMTGHANDGYLYMGLKSTSKPLIQIVPW